jgi:hypothetical protein
MTLKGMAKQGKKEKTTHVKTARTPESQMFMRDVPWKYTTE